MKEKINELAEKLMALPEEISDLQIRAISQNEVIQHISEKILARESEIKAEINASTDENGKKLYSNEESRKLAFLSDTKDDSTLIDLYQEKKLASNNLEVTRISIEKHSNEQRNIRSILSVINLVTES